MSIDVIENPLPGERVLALSPPDALAAATTWRRRPNLFPGRALSAPTLQARSQWSTGRIATRGQAFTAGVLRGLQVGHTTADATDGERRAVRLHVAPGQGLAQSGEDVVLARAIEADFWSLPVVAPPGVLTGEGGFASDGLQPRAIGDGLGQLLDDLPGVLPPAGVLVLQPVSVDRAEIDPDDPCDRCPCDGNISYEDWRLVDGARLLWYAWPLDWAPLPPADPRRRNRLAWRVFDAERALASDALLPWEEFGVPLALVGLDGEFLPEFIDHASVVRRGGRSRHEVLRLAGAGALDASTRLPPLRQAQIEQLAEHLAVLGDDATPAQLAAQFDRLPPFGLLPREAVDIAGRRSPLFPGGFDLDAVPVPLEQLDLALRESAGLAPLDFARGERVRLLVPVGQTSWEPRLLLTETIDPEFAATLEHFLSTRADVLARRQYLRLRGATLMTALRGDAPPVPPIGEDAQALEPESLAGWGPPPGASGGHRSALARGLHESRFDGADAPLAIARTPLYAWAYLDPLHPPRTLMLEFRDGEDVRRAYWGENLIDRGEDGTPTRMRIGELPAPGRWLRLELDPAALLLSGGSTFNATGMSLVLHEGRAALAGVGRITTDGEAPWLSDALPAGAASAQDAPMEFFGADSLMAPFEPDYGVVAVPAEGDAPATRDSRALRELAEDPRFTGVLSVLEQAQLRARGVEGFIAYLKSRADRADDLVDYGFVKVQTDIYRIRQLVLGNTKASRLAVSPALANIAQAETAAASHERISEFFKDIEDAAETQPARLGRAGASRANFASLTDAAMIDTFDKSSASLATSKVVFQDATREAVLEPEPTLQFDKLQLIAPATFKTRYIPSDISNATPIIGKVNLRTMRIAERLKLPETQEARDYSTSTRHDSVQALVRLADELIREDGGVAGETDDLPGLFKDTEVWGLEGDPFVKDAPEPGRRTLAAFIADRALLLQLLKPPIRTLAGDGQPVSGDEASLFSDSADLSDRTVALFRQVEARVRLYRDLIDRCEGALDALRTDLQALSTRERATAGELAEARHDIAVTRALIDEEQVRLDAINARRAAVLEREVRFVAYMRPRAADNLAEVPVRALDPGLLEAPAPACLQSHADLPEELSQMLAMVREAPADWFRRGPELLRPLDRPELLRRVLETARLRLPILQRRSPKAEPAAAVAAGGLAAAIAKVQLAQRQRVVQVRAPLLQLDLANLGKQSWRRVFDQAASAVSLGDLIDGEHGQGRAVRDAAAMFERFGRICGCLHAAFSEVPPSIRLDWAEALSQFDRTPSLRQLSSLARWSELDYARRHRLQGLVDWLYDQIEFAQPAARELIDDVVRICLLLASHAPVGRIIAGRLPRPVTARPGLRIPLLALEPSRLRIGMQALMYRNDRIVARAVVEDLADGEASARVVHTEQASVELDEGVRVQFSETTSIGFAAMIGRAKVF